MEVVRSEARFKVLACGRRWGKTRLATALCIAEALRGGRAWWVAPTYKVALVGWRMLKEMASGVPVAEIREGNMTISFPGGGTITAKSADRPDGLRGEGLDFVSLDECAFMREDAWYNALRPALADRLGRAVFISTPAGRNWFWRVWQDAQEADGWQAWQHPTSDNPFIPASEIEDARQHLPDRVFRQEFLAEFIDDAGGVFRGVSAAAVAVEQERAVEGHQYAIGVDWGKYNDFTVFAVLDVTGGALVALERFNMIDYSLQRQRLEAVCERFLPFVIVAERNAMGDPVVEELQRSGLPVQPFTTTNASKKQAVEALALAIESGALKLLPDRTLLAELAAFEAVRLPSGMLRYAAPAGYHDDCVIALALAWQAVAGGDAGPLLLWG